MHNLLQVPVIAGINFHQNFSIGNFAFFKRWILVLNKVQNTLIKYRRNSIVDRVLLYLSLFRFLTADGNDVIFTFRTFSQLFYLFIFFTEQLILLHSKWLMQRLLYHTEMFNDSLLLNFFAAIKFMSSDVVLFIHCDISYLSNKTLNTQRYPFKFNLNLVLKSTLH